MKIRFTKHAVEKFEVLSRHGVKISKRKVIETIESPDLVDHTRLPFLIAQSELNAKHVLRVVYKKKFSYIVIITFYPGRKSQYGQKI